MVFPELNDGASSVRGLLSRNRDPEQEEAEPAFPIAVRTDGHEPVVIFGPSALQVGAEVEEWSVKNASVYQKKCDQEATDTAIAIKEGMDRFELNMGNCAMHESRHVIVTMQEMFEIVQRSMHIGYRRRHEDRVLKRCVGRANPVLCRAELT